MTVTHIGKLNLLGVIPSFGQALTKLDSMGAQLSTFKSDKSGLVSRATSQLSPLLSAVSDVQSLVKQGQALMTQADALIGSTAQLASGLRVSLGTAGVDLYRFDGDVSSLGAELQASAVGSGSGHALILIAQDAGAWAAIQAILKTS